MKELSEPGWERQEMRSREEAEGPDHIGPEAKVGILLFSVLLESFEKRSDVM